MNEKVGSSFISFIKDSCILINDIDVLQDHHTTYYKMIYCKKDKSRIIRLAKEFDFSKSVFPMGFVDGYVFIYKSKEPLVFIKKNTVIELWDQLCCKSFFQKAWLPLDKMIVENIWENVNEASG